MMNNTAKNTSKAIALFLSLGLMSSLIGCEAGGEDDVGDDAPTEQTAPELENEEGGEGDAGDDAPTEQTAPELENEEGGEGGEG